MASSAEVLAAQARQLQQAIAFFVVRETMPEKSSGETDVTEALRTLLKAKGTDDPALAAMLKMFLTPPEPNSSKHDAKKQAAHSPTEHRPPETLSEKKAANDEFDKDFERF